MTITVTFIDKAMALAHVWSAPSWIDRMLFGARLIDGLACATAAPSGGRLWLWDSTGRRIADRRIVAAIERARRGADSAQGWAVPA